MSRLSLEALLVGTLVVAGSILAPRAAPFPEPEGLVPAACPSARPRSLLGLVARPLSLAEMVSELERGCLALDDVHFLPGQDTIESLSPSQFALVARALGMAQGAYQVAVPAEATPGGQPDTLQARRRETRLRDELVHYGASSSRLVEDPQRAVPTVVVAPGTAVPMLVRVPES